ncbi:hypothetical protein HN011_000910, partial [Eciton burchellii]
HSIKDNRKTPIMAAKEAARYIRIVEINVGRSLTAMTELREYCHRHKVNIACIQEPAIRYGKLVSVPEASTSIFHSKDLMTAIIMFNRNLVITKMSQETDWHLVTDEVQLNRKSFYVINQYCQFSDSIEDHMSKLSNMRLLAQQRNAVYCANVIAKSSLCPD